VPAATIGGVTIAHVHGAPLTIGAFNLNNLALPNATANDVVSGPMNIPVPRPDVSLPDLELGIFDVQLIVTPLATMVIDSMHLSGVKAGATVGTVEVHNVTLPYDALHITLANVGIETVAMPTIGVA